MRLNRFTQAFLLILFVQIVAIVNVPAQVVADFGKYEITLDEFEHAYAKNVGGWENAMKQEMTDYKNFLDLYVKFRMKLRDAQVRAYDKDPDLMNELNGTDLSSGIYLVRMIADNYQKTIKITLLK